MKKKYLKNKDVYIFDLDGVVLDIESINYFCYKTVLYNIFKKKISLDEYNRYFKWRKGIDAIDQYINRHNIIDLSWKKTKELLRTIFNVKKQKIENENLDKFLIPWVTKWIKFLNEKSYTIILATSTISVFTNIILERLKIKHFFDYIITAEDVIKGKPAPDIYQLSLYKCWNIDPRKAIVFEDSLAWVDASLSAKIFCIWIWILLKNKNIKNKNYIFWGVNFMSFL